MTCKHESDCKGYTPEDKLPFIKVEAWYWHKEGLIINCPRSRGNNIFTSVSEDIWKREYTFRGQPDWKRLVHETLEQGAEVVKVTPVEGSMNEHAKGMTSMPMTLCIYEIYPAVNSRRFCDIRPDTWVSWSGIPDTDIEHAIREHHKEESKPVRPAVPADFEREAPK